MTAPASQHAPVSQATLSTAGRTVGDSFRLSPLLQCRTAAKTPLNTCPVPGCREDLSQHVPGARLQRRPLSAHAQCLLRRIPRGPIASGSRCWFSKRKRETSLPPFGPSFLPALSPFPLLCPLFLLSSILTGSHAVHFGLILAV